MPVTYRTMTQYDLGGAKGECLCGRTMHAGDDGAWATKYIGPVCSARCAKLAEERDRRDRETWDTESEVRQ